MARSTSTSTSKSTPTSTAKGRRAPPLTRGDRKRTRTQRPSLSPSPSLSDSSALSSIPSGHGPEPTSKPLPLPKSADERQPEPEPQSSTHLSPPSIPHARIAALDAVRVPLDAGDVLYIPDFVSAEQAEGWYDALDALPTWHHPTLTVYGRPVTQSRAVAVYATSPRSTRYSGAEVATHSPLPPLLEEIRALVQARLGVVFDTCMLNRYDGGGVYIGRHSDTRENKVIASLSLGAARTFIMTPRLPPREAGIVLTPARKKELEARRNERWILEDRSLVVMQGRTQDFWKHEIPKELKVKAGRISLTFRQTE